MNMANPTAPTKTATPSLPKPLVITASPVCSPTGPPVLLPLAPAVPLGVEPPLAPPPTTVTAVIVLWLPSGSVLVLTDVLVMEDFGADELLLLEPEELMVRAPPPMVETMMWPEASVVLMTSPWVTEEEAGAEVVEETRIEEAMGVDDEASEVDEATEEEAGALLVGASVLEKIEAGVESVVIGATGVTWPEVVGVSVGVMTGVEAVVVPLMAVPTS